MINTVAKSNTRGFLAGTDKKVDLLLKVTSPRSIHSSRKHKPGLISEQIQQHKSKPGALWKRTVK